MSKRTIAMVVLSQLIVAGSLFTCRNQAVDDQYPAMEKRIFSWDDFEAENHGLPESRCRIKAATGEKLQLIWAEFQPGGAYETHSHPHEQFSIMVQGRMEVFVGDEIGEVVPGDMWYVPPNVVHGGKLLGDEPVIFVDAFHPIREDVLDEMERVRAIRLSEEVSVSQLKIEQDVIDSQIAVLEAQKAALQAKIDAALKLEPND